MPTYFSESWKDIKGYEGYYQVSDHGRVRSVKRFVPHRYSGKLTIRERIIAARNSGTGYLMVSLCKQGRYGHFVVHRLVATAFLGEGGKGREVCHSDGVKQNNHISNLRWDTREANCRDRLFHGVARKLTRENVVEIRRLYATGQFSQAVLAKRFGVCGSMIGNVIRREAWRIK